MKDFFDNFKKGLTIGFGFFLMFSIVGVIFASIDTKSEGDTLKSSDWNKLVSEVNTLPGMITAFATNSCPNGWIAADGTNGTPDLRGIFIRGANDFGTGPNNRDIDRENSGSGILTYQLDAIKNIKGVFGIMNNRLPDSLYTTGPFGQYTTDSLGNSLIGGGASNKNGGTSFDASLVVNTGDDVRPKNISLIYCVKQ